MPNVHHLAEYVALARTGVRLGLGDPDTLRLAAYIIALPGGQFAEALAIIDRAVILNPTSVETLAMSGMLRAYAGDTEAALRHLKEADRLSPPGVPIDIKLFGFCLACFVANDYAGVLHWTELSLQANSANIVALRFKAAALALLGRRDEAKEIIREMLRLNPKCTLSRFRRHLDVDMKNPFKRPEVAEAYYEGLSLAGLPE
jgi:tetratricopeptide (TPR) repeat protein